MTITEEENANFHSVLESAGRSPGIPEAEDIYGWLVGSWELDVLVYGADVAEQGLKGEAHFAWTLEGLAVQDVWIMPRRADRPEYPAEAPRMYGTTLRVWDSSISAWRITWIDPGAGRRDELIGRRCGKDIVQIGTQANGTPIRWTFTEITPGSFHWIGEVLQADGKTWNAAGEFRARRIG